MRFLIPFLFLSFFLQGQKDSASALPLVGINFGGQLPYGDLANRFGLNLRAGGSFLIKTKKNWVYGIDAFYMFGRNVKEDVLVNLKNSEGNITDNEGYPADLRVTERGIGVHAHFGRIFNIDKAFPNSGILVTVGVGYLQHKVNLYDAQNRVAAVYKDMKKGYDRFSGGPSISQFLGYIHLSENRLLNFYFGFECYQTFAKSFRKINYTTGQPDTKKRFDGLLGFRAGWILPLYKKKPNEYYYN